MEQPKIVLIIFISILALPQSRAEDAAASADAAGATATQGAYAAQQDQQSKEGSGDPQAQEQAALQAAQSAINQAVSQMNHAVADTARAADPVSETGLGSGTDFSQAAQASMAEKPAQTTPQQPQPQAQPQSGGGGGGGGNGGGGGSPMPPMMPPPSQDQGKKDSQSDPPPQAGQQVQQQQPPSPQTQPQGPSQEVVDLSKEVFALQEENKRLSAENSTPVTTASDALAEQLAQMQEQQTAALQALQETFKITAQTKNGTQPSKMTTADVLSGASDHIDNTPSLSQAMRRVRLLRAVKEKPLVINQVRKLHQKR